MHTNYTNKNEKLIYPELSYTLTGICFEVHNELGRYAREKQYGDLLEKKLKERKISHKRELRIDKTGNIVCQRVNCENEKMISAGKSLEATSQQISLGS